jgi:uncharacterized protein (DUF302 family)
MVVEGLITTPSAFGPAETMHRLRAEATARGLEIFAQVDHAKGAAAVGLPLRPTDLLIFGAARGGTPLMQQAQTVGIDLPLKALVWQDEGGATFISYNDPEWLAERHGLSPKPTATLNALAGVLKAIVTAAASK